MSYHKMKKNDMQMIYHDSLDLAVYINAEFMHTTEASLHDIVGNTHTSNHLIAYKSKSF